VKQNFVKALLTICPITVVGIPAITLINTACSTEPDYKPDGSD
jgi:hypothetical protein